MILVARPGAGAGSNGGSTLLFFKINIGSGAAEPSPQIYLTAARAENTHVIAAWHGAAWRRGAGWCRLDCAHLYL